MCTELLKVQPKNYTFFMVVNEDFKKRKTNRPELDYRTRR